jgi:hypothetical protein
VSVAAGKLFTSLSRHLYNATDNFSKCSKFQNAEFLGVKNLGGGDKKTKIKAKITKSYWKEIPCGSLQREET